MNAHRVSPGALQEGDPNYRSAHPALLDDGFNDRPEAATKTQKRRKWQQSCFGQSVAKCPNGAAWRVTSLVGVAIVVVATGCIYADRLSCCVIEPFILVAILGQ